MTAAGSQRVALLGGGDAPPRPGFRRWMALMLLLASRPTADDLPVARCRGDTPAPGLQWAGWLISNAVAKVVAAVGSVNGMVGDWPSVWAENRPGDAPVP